jgi:AcrR family transcriptional regulator
LVAPPRRSDRQPYTVDSLTDIAVALFITRGYDATRIEHIAKAANISQSSLYHHVRGKEDLLKRALERAVSTHWAILDEPASRDGGEAVTRLIHIMQRLMTEQLGLQPEMTLLHRARGNNRTEQWAIDEIRQFEGIVSDLVHEAQANGKLRADLDAGLMVHLAFGMTDSVVEWFRPDGTWSHRQVIDTLLAVMLDGTRPV